MKTYIEAKLVAVSHEEFQDKEKAGETISYNINVLKTTDGELLNANSKADFSACEGKTGVAGVEAKVNRRGDIVYSLREFLPDTVLGLPEAEIA